MNYSRKDLADLLALRYVIGLMSGSARVRFNKLLAQNEILRNGLEQWEELLAPLAWSLKPVQPSELVLPRLIKRIREKEKSQLNAHSTAVATKKDRRSWFMTSAAAALAIVSSLGWWQSTQQAPKIITERVVETVTQTVPEFADIAVINSTEGQPLWITRIYTESERLDIQVQTKPDEVSDKDYQLWALTAEGTPVSLGLLPKSGEISVELDSSMLTALQTTGTLAVSLEPLGGSPELVPTGPVLFTAPLFAGEQSPDS